MIQGYLDTREVSKKLNITVSAVNRLASRGTLAYVWMSGRRLYHAQVIANYLSDKAAQKRRRNIDSKLQLDLEELTVDQVVEGLTK